MSLCEQRNVEGHIMHYSTTDSCHLLPVPLLLGKVVLNGQETGCISFFQATFFLTSHQKFLNIFCCLFGFLLYIGYYGLFAWNNSW